MRKYLEACEYEEAYPKNYEEMTMKELFQSMDDSFDHLKTVMEQLEYVKTREEWTQQQQ